MRVAVMGTGGMGGYFGGLLARAGHDVAFIARGAHLQAILERGLRFENAVSGEFTVWGQATNDPSQVGEVGPGVVHREDLSQRSGDTRPSANDGARLRRSDDAERRRKRR